MGRYIDADALGIDYCNPDVFENKGYADGWNSAIKILKDAPTADVAPVVHAHWERPFPTTPKSYVRICSVCKGKAYAIGKEYDYCPNCHAVMDEEKNK